KQQYNPSEQIIDGSSTARNGSRRSAAFLVSRLSRVRHSPDPRGDCGRSCAADSRLRPPNPGQSRAAWPMRTRVGLWSPRDRPPEYAGFPLLRLTSTNATLFAPLALVRAFHRWRGLSDAAEAQQEISVPAAPLNAALTGMLLLESVWVRVVDNPFGSSLLCLA